MEVLAAMFSDAHLRGGDDPNEERLARRVEGLEVAELVLLGDIFQSWWGWPAEVDQGHGRLLRALEAVVARGTRLSVLPGNHDFFPGPVFTERLGARVGERLELELAGRRFLLLHGDQADRSPGYRGLHRILRGAPFSALMGLLGPVRGQVLGRALAGAGHGPRAPDASLATAQRELAWELLGQGPEVVVMGHCHAPELTTWERGRYVNLGDYLHRHTWLSVEDDGALRLRADGFA